ncbi:MAG: hypothetical protein V1908_01690 [Candidatus Peregrinibacteria bacterium]
MSGLTAREEGASEVDAAITQLLSGPDGENFFLLIVAGHSSVTNALRNFRERVVGAGVSGDLEALALSVGVGRNDDIPAGLDCHLLTPGEIEGVEAARKRMATLTH